MSIVTNATTKAQKNIVDAFVTAAGGDAEFIDAELTFDTKAKALLIRYEDQGLDATLPYEDAKALFARNFQAAVEPEPQAEPAEPARPEPQPFSPQPKPARKGKAAKAKADKPEPAPKPPKPEPKAETVPSPDSPRIKTLREAMEQAALDLATDIDKERTGELSSTAARYAKGAHLDRMEGIANDLKGAGDPDFAKRGAARAFARSLIERQMENRHGVIDPKDRLSNQEMTYTTTVFQTYLKFQGGLDATFQAVDAIDKQTKQPLVNDSGEPYEFPVTNIALQKLYILAAFYLDDARDKILSFAHRNTQKVVAAAAKLMDANKGNVAEVIDAINQAQANAQDDDLDPEEAALDHVAEQRGETPPSTVKSIKVDAGWFGGDWTDIKRVATQIAVSFGLPLGDNGEIGNTFLLERLLNVYAPRLYGANNIVQMMVETDTIDEAQARKFLAEFAGIGDDDFVKDADEVTEPEGDDE